MATRDSDTPEESEMSLETDFISAPLNDDETVQTVALGLCNYQKNLTLNPSTESGQKEFVRQEGRDQEVLFQSAGQDSGTGSAEEETSPFGSPGNEKFEACAPSVQKVTKQKRTVRDFGETVEESRIMVNAIMRNEQALEYELFQCSGVRKTSESDSDSGKEEMTPRTEKHNVIAITGKATDAIDLPPDFPPNITGKGCINISIPSIQSLTNDSSNNDTRLTDEQFDLWKNFVAFGWPHKSPSAKTMAVAGFRYLGSYLVKDGSRTRTVHDLVECCRCGKTLHSFEHEDDPRQEHLKLHGHCP